MDDELKERLVEQIRADSVEALGEYLNHSRIRLTGLLRKITGQHLLQVVELDDLFQEVARSAIAAFAKVPKQDLDIDRWLDQLARRRVVDTHREQFGAKKRSQSRNQVFSQMADAADPNSGGFEQFLIASMTSASMAVSRDWKVVRIQQAVSELDEEQQLILRLRFSEGLPTNQIAERTGKSDGAIRVAISRIVARLQSILVDQPES